MSSLISLSPSMQNLVISSVDTSYTSASGLQFGVRYEKRPPGQDIPGVSPSLYFRFVKSKLQKNEQTILRKKLIKLQKIVNNSKELGQQALYEKVLETIAITVRELECAACGYDRWVTRDVLDKFRKVYMPSGSKIMYFEPWEKFPRTPPPDIVEKIKRVRDLKLFDEYHVLYLDYANDPLKTNKDKIREKDPILFGKFAYAPDKYYFTADWIDECCDLTFDKFIETMSDPVDRKIPELSQEYFDEVKKEVMDRHDRLKNSHNANFRQNMVEEDRLRDAKTKKPWWKFWSK